MKKTEEVEKSRKELQIVTTKLSKYLSPQVYEMIFSGEQNEILHTQRKKLSIFFSDIVSFTEITENLEAEELSEMLNAYLTLMSDIALKWGGTIDKFIGDAVMIFFGDPLSEGITEDAAKCVSMALDMQSKMMDFREKQRKTGITKPFHIRIGIATGFTTVGNFGSSSRMDYTIIGSYVNLAARLESAAEKDTVLISEETFQMIQTKFLMKKETKISVKGFSKSIQTYQVLGESD